MKHSSDRILTTHVGSLPRPDVLAARLRARYDGADDDPSTFTALLESTIGNVVRRQVEAGVDVVSDGEMGKVSYTHYVKDRLHGVVAGEAAGPPAGMRRVPPEFTDHPDWAADRAREGGGPGSFAQPRCIGTLSYGDGVPLASELAIYAKAVGDAKPVDAFVNSASPGVLAGFIANQHYASQGAYVAALADAMQAEYEAIVSAGFVLQIDSPDLAATRHLWMSELTDEEYLRSVAFNLELLNHATRNIAPDSMRIHVCWGNYAGPHDHDIPVAKLFDLLASCRAQAISFEGANPRHEHEWEDWAEASIPDDKILIPGVIDSTSNFVEHPRLIAQRICRYASVVGRDRVIAGADCGFATYIGKPQVYPSIVWAKLRALVDGARIASRMLWGATV